MKRILMMLIALTVATTAAAQNFSVTLNESDSVIMYEVTAEYDGDPLTSSTPTRELTYLFGITHGEKYYTSLFGDEFTSLEIGILEECSAATVSSGENSYRHTLLPEIDKEDGNKLLETALTLSNGELIFYHDTFLDYIDDELFTLSLDFEDGFNRCSHYKEEYGNETRYIYNQLCRYDIINIRLCGVDFPIDPTRFSTAKIMRALVQRLNQEFDYDEDLLLPDERALKNWGPAPGNPPVHEAELDEDTEKRVMWLQKDISRSYGNDSERVFMFHTAFISRKLYLDDNMDGRSVEFSLLIQDEETEASERENEKSYEDLKEEFGLEEEGDREFERITVVLANGEKISHSTFVRYDTFKSFYISITFHLADSDRYKESYGNPIKYLLNQMCRHDIVNIIIDDVEFPINPSLFSTSQLMREYVRLHNAKFGYGYYPHIPDERRLDQWDAASSYSSSYIPSTSSGGNFANVSQASNTEAPVKSISIPASANVKDIYVEHDVTVNGEKGINVVCSFDVSMLGTDGICAAYIYNADGTPLKDTNKRYSTSNGYVANHTVFTPQGFSSSFDNLKIFFPYSELHIDMNKYTPLKVYFGVFNSITLEKLGESPWSEFYCASGSSTNQTNITLTQADATDKQSLSATQLVMKPFGLLNINLNPYTIDNALKALNEYEGFSPHVSEKSISLSKFSGYNYRVNNLNIDNASLYISGNYISYGYDTRIKKSDITLEEMVNHAHEIVNSLRKDGAIIIEDVPTEELTLPHAARIMKASRKSSGTLFEFNGIYKGRRIELKIYIGAVSEVGDGYGISLNIIKG